MPFRFHIDKKDLQFWETIVFDYNEVGIPRQGFLARLEDGWVAYENRCRHLPISLDMDDNQFFTRDKAYFFCQSHGALYEPQTGKCVQGPCAGAALKPIPLIIQEHQIGIETED